jgi:hypothetical protein
MVEQPSLTTAGDEVVHAETGAVVVEAPGAGRLARGQTTTLPLGRGLRYRVVRPLAAIASEVEIEEVDAGLLAVTSRRVVFTGETICIDMPYRHLLHIQVFSDAIRFGTAAADSAPLLMLGPVDAIGATIGAAAERAI